MGASASKFEGELCQSVPEPDASHYELLAGQIRHFWGVFTRHNIQGTFHIYAESLSEGKLLDSNPIVIIKFADHNLGFKYSLQTDAAFLQGSGSDVVSLELACIGAYVMDTPPIVGSLESDEMNDILKHWASTQKAKRYSIYFHQNALAIQLLEHLRGEKFVAALPESFRFKSSPLLPLRWQYGDNAQIWTSRTSYTKLLQLYSGRLLLCFITNDTTIEPDQWIEIPEGKERKIHYQCIVRNVKIRYGDRDGSEPFSPDDSRLTVIPMLTVDFNSLDHRDRSLELLVQAKNQNTKSTPTWGSEDRQTEKASARGPGIADSPSSSNSNRKRSLPLNLSAARQSLPDQNEKPCAHNLEPAASGLDEETALRAFLCEMSNVDPSRRYEDYGDALIAEDITLDLIRTADVKLLKETGLTIGMIAKMRKALENDEG